MRLAEEAPFSTIQEEDIDWGTEGQWGQGQPEDRAFSSVAGGQDEGAPWNGFSGANGPDPSWTSTQEGSAWGAFYSVTQKASIDEKHDGGQNPGTTRMAVAEQREETRQRQEHRDH